ncbi:MAG: hypothetical protein ACJ8AT_11055 [Hyalangium sp.]|uniref:hypothetical protein n=1 Tax=Hyalangium sp. TaxID=2028555 RepID=UPI00389B0B4E
MDAPLATWSGESPLPGGIRARLEGLIASGDIKTVPFNGRVRIPLAEVERILNEGIPTVDAPRPRIRRPIRASTPELSESPGEKIRKLKF